MRKKDETKDIDRDEMRENRERERVIRNERDISYTPPLSPTALHYKFIPLSFPGVTFPLPLHFRLQLFH